MATGFEREDEGVISDEETRERIRQFAGATGRTMAEFSEGMKRLTGVLAAAARNMGQLATIRAEEGEGAAGKAGG